MPQNPVTEPRRHHEPAEHPRIHRLPASALPRSLSGGEGPSVDRVLSSHRAPSQIGDPSPPPAPSAAAAPGRPPRYGPEVATLLHQVWEASDYLCGKRLAPFLPSLVDALERHGALQVPATLRPTLLRLSPATIDRLLRPHRRRPPRGLATPGPGHPALAAQVPLRTFSDGQDVQPGALQADLVAHCGESTAGFYLTSLVAVDVATGWTECQALWGKGYHRVGSAIHHVRQRLPMPLREFHTDNGGEFLTHLLIP